MADIAPAAALPAAPPAGGFARTLRWLKVHTGHVVTLSLLVGVVAGLGAVLFSVMLDFVDTLVMAHWAGYIMPKPGAEGGVTVLGPPLHRWVLLIAPAMGGLLTGLLIYTFAPEAEGHGTDSVIDSFHRHKGVIRARVPLIKTVASVLTIGTGGSAGREGPIGQIGAGFASALAGFLKTRDRDRRLLILAGAGAGIGAIFRAPLGGALFAVEVLYREAEFESAAIVPAFVAAIVAYSVYSSITGVWGPIFTVPTLEFLQPVELLFFVLLGIACVLAGMLYVKSFYAIRDFFRALKIPNHVKPAIGGLAVGAIGWFAPEILGMGYGWGQLAIDGKLALSTALLLLLLKTLATGLTIGSGGSGGVFAPSMLIGGMLGYVLGIAFHAMAPSIANQPAAFVLVGMAGFFAGAAKTPVSSLVMVSEMTSGYGLLVPLMLTNAISFLFTPRSISIYEKQVNTRAESGAHDREFFYDILDRIRVDECVKPSNHLLTFARNTPLRDIMQRISGADQASADQAVFPVLNDDATLYGIIDLDDLRILLDIHALSPGLVVAEDVCFRDFRVATPDETLATALQKLRKTRLEAIPVVVSNDDASLWGIVGRRDIGNAYHDYLYRDHAAKV